MANEKDSNSELQIATVGIIITFPVFLFAQYLSRYFSRRRKSSTDLTNGSTRFKRQISGQNLNSVNSNTDDGQYESKEPLTSQPKMGLIHGKLS